MLLAATLIALALLAYTYAGYPLLIAALSRLRPLPVRTDEGYRPTVTVCMAAWNGAAHLARKVESLAALDYPPELLEILIYSDGSSDSTVELAERLAARDPRIRCLRSTERLGKPTALNAMREAAGGEVLLMTDVRQPLEPGSLRALLRVLADPRVGCDSGNLTLRVPAGAGFYWSYENRIRAAEGRFRSMVGVSGSIYVVRRADLAPVPAELILDDMFIPMRLRLAGRRIAYAADAVAYDEAFSDEREFGRKTRTLAGNVQLFTLLPQLLWSPGTLFELYSHKVLRLLGPFLLAFLLTVSTLAALVEAHPPWLESGVRALVLGQLAFYALALLGGRGGKLGVVARTFVVMNLAALVGMWRFARGAQRVTW